MEWPIVKLGDISELITKGTTPTSVGFKFTEIGINFIKVESITTSGTFLPSKFAAISEDCNEALKRSQLKVGDVLFSIAGALGRTALVTQDILPANTNQALAIIRLKSDLQIDKRFLMLALTTGVTLEQVDKHKGGVAQQNLSLGQLKTFEIPLPPIQEQKRIVAILDQAFADIDKARALTEQNLKNARELFESYLQQVFSQRGEGWQETKVGDVLSLEYGKPLDKSLRKEDGQYPAYGANGIKARSDEFYREEPSIIVGRKGSAGELTLTEEKYWPLDVTYFVDYDVQKYDLTFLFYLLSRLNLPSLATGVKPGINRNVVYDLKVSVPALNEQKRIVGELNTLSKNIEVLEDIYLKKLSIIEELKKSFLQKAFSGELTKNKKEAA